MPYAGDQAPGVIEIDPFAKFLYLVHGGGTATRYPIAVGRAGKTLRNATVIRRTVKFSDSTVAGEPITTYAGDSTGADAYRQLAKEVLDRWHDG